MNCKISLPPGFSVRQLPSSSYECWCFRTPAFSFCFSRVFYFTMRGILYSTLDTSTRHLTLQTVHQPIPGSTQTIQRFKTKESPRASNSYNYNIQAGVHSIVTGSGVIFVCERESPLLLLSLKYVFCDLIATRSCLTT